MIFLLDNNCYLLVNNGYPIFVHGRFSDVFWDLPLRRPQDFENFRNWLEPEADLLSMREWLRGKTPAWRITPVSMWLLSMISKSPKYGCSPSKWPFHGF